MSAKDSRYSEEMKAWWIWRASRFGVGPIRVGCEVRKLLVQGDLKAYCEGRSSVVLCS